MNDNYTTVDAVIIDTCHKIGDMGLRKYAQLFAHALSWFTADYNPESGQTLKTVLLDVSPDRTANLPDDYLDFVVVGRQYGDKIRTLAHNPKLSPLPPVEPFLDRTPLDVYPDALWPCYEYAGWGGGSLYGYGWGEYQEEFTFDAQDRTLRLSSMMTTDEPLYFQYRSSDLNPGKPTPLHPAYALTLEHWMMWHYHLYKGETGPAQMHERYYYTFRRKAKAQLLPFSLKDFQNIVRSCYGQIR